MIDPSLAAAIIDASVDVTLVVDRAGTITGVAGPVEHLLGWEADELVGRSIEVLVPASSVPRHEVLRHQYAHAPQARQMADGTVRPARHRSGRRVQVEVGLAPLGDGAGSVAVTVRDAAPRLRHDLEREHDRQQTEALMAVAAERDRIARNLHDNVIQRLFGTGLQLQASMMRPDLGDRVALAVDEIDEIIREIRSTIFALQTPRVLLEGLELSLRSVAAEAARLLGHDPEVSVRGDPDRVPHQLAFETLLVVRELLTNVTKHAHATRTTVALDVGADAMSVVVDDDGVGYARDDQRAGRGVDNLVSRAVDRGGRFDVGPRRPQGTHAVWSVPLGR